ncbi:DUF6988 family protein [Vibrio fluvialis]|uniref:DUF6988 family protein n=1 Tax=Vibrio fluvialis TaxID=676 RepID=UPI001F2A05B1|nr:hypothetical protein [Vibrio fluvialis]MCE7622110.1 hypothetical protein [Vibrio fluvialis]
MTLELAESWVRSYEKLLSGLQFHPEHKKIVPLTLLQLALEHNAAIVRLIGLGFHGSAFALLRPQRDAFLRGIWLFRCASEHQLNNFMAGKEPPGIKTQLEQLEQTDGYRHGHLSQRMIEIKDFLHDLTHGGLYQSASREKNDRIAGGHSDDQILWLLKQSLMLSYLTTLEVCHIFNNGTKAQELTLLFNEMMKSSK